MKKGTGFSECKEMMKQHCFLNEIGKYKERIAIETEDRAISYESLVEIADHIAAHISDRCLIFCISGNNIESISGFVGFLRRRIVPIMVNPSVNKELYNDLYKTYRPQYVWGPKNFITWEKADFEYGEYGLVKTPFDDVPAMADDLALLLTTSGSTGSPKLVRQTYRNIDVNMTSFLEAVKSTDEDCVITTMPMSYTYCLSLIEMHLMKGLRIVATEKTLFDKTFWELLKEKQATTFGAVPYSFMMLKRLRFLETDYPSIRYITQGGGKLDKELHYEYALKMREKGQSFIVTYGATEATSIMSYLPPEHAVEKAGSIGIAVPGGRFEILDTDGSAVMIPEKIGELVFYGENITPGYAERREDLNNKDERKGRLETGDMAIRDLDGYYYIVGRKKRFLKMFGNRVNLMEVEELLLKRGFETACVGEDDHMRIYTTEHDVETVRRSASELTGINRAGFTAIHIDAIPRNDAGKTLYSKLE